MGAMTWHVFGLRTCHIKCRHVSSAGVIVYMLVGLSSVVRLYA